MKRKILVASLITLLFTVICTAAFAFTIDGYTDPLLFQIGLPTEAPVSGGFYSQGFVFTSSYEPVSTLTWAITPIDGGPSLTITPEGSDRNSRRAWLNLDPNTAYDVGGGTYHYTIQAGFPNGDPVTTTVSVSFNQAALPDSYSITMARMLSSDSLDTAVPLQNNSFEMIRGATYVFTETFGTNDVFNTYTVTTPDTGSSEWDEYFAFEYPDLNINQDYQQIFKARINGIYSHCFIAQFIASNVACYMPYTLRIVDTAGGGEVTTPEIQISHNRLEYDMNFYIGMELLDNNAYYYEQVRTERQIDHFYFDNADAMQIVYPDDTVQWTLTRLQGTSELMMDFSMLPDMDLVISKLPISAEDGQWKITCDWGNAHWETVYTVHFLNSPTGLPTGLDISFGDTLVVKTGNRLGLAEKVSFKDNWSIPGEEIYTNIGGTNWHDGVTHDENWNWDVANIPGVYNCNVSKYCGNIIWTEPFTLIVTNEEGEFPDPKIQIHHNRQEYETNFYIGMEVRDIHVTNYGEVGIDWQIDHFYFDNPDVIGTAYPDNTVQWTLTQLQGTAELIMDMSMLPDMDLDINKLPASAEEGQWKITCDWGDAHWETIYSVHFLDSPTGLPIGLDISFGDTLVVKTGEKLDLAEKVSFKDNWFIPGEDIETNIGGGDNWQDAVTHDENWIWNLANIPGCYDCAVTKKCRNVTWTEPFRLIVTDENGNVPGFDGDVSWSYENGVLTISGVGLMESYDSEEPGPWFVYKDNIRKVIIENGLTSIGAYAFFDYPAIEEVDIAGNVKWIYDCAFQFCEQLRIVNFSEGLTNIDSAAFFGCSHLTSITLPRSLKSIGYIAFADCSLTNISVAGGAKIHHFFYLDDMGERLYHISLPEDVTEVGEGAFCSNSLPYDTPDYIMPDELAAIEAQAFMGTSAEYVWLDENVTSIGASAFADSGIRYVYIPYGCSFIGDGAFPENTVILGGINANFEAGYAKTWAENNNYEYIGLEAPFSGNG